MRISCKSRVAIKFTFLIVYEFSAKYKFALKFVSQFVYGFNSAYYLGKDRKLLVLIQGVLETHLANLSRAYSKG